MSQRLKVLSIVGARPNLPKIAPLIREMRCRPGIDPILVHTGQHYDEKLSDIFGCTPCLWDGHAAERIVETLMRETPRVASDTHKPSEDTRYPALVK